MTHTDEELLDDLQRVADRVSGAPTAHEYEVFGNYNLGTFYTHFESWTEAVRLAGFEPRQSGRPRADPDDLLADLQSVIDHVGQIPTQKEYREHGNYSHNTFYRHFDSWQAALDNVEVPEQ